MSRSHNLLFVTPLLRCAGVPSFVELWRFIWFLELKVQDLLPQQHSTQVSGLKVCITREASSFFLTKTVYPRKGALNYRKVQNEINPWLIATTEEGVKWPSSSRNYTAPGSIFSYS